MCDLENSSKLFLNRFLLVVVIFLMHLLRNLQKPILHIFHRMWFLQVLYAFVSVNQYQLRKTLNSHAVWQVII